MTEQDYRSKENEMKYMSYSQFTDFLDCEAKALAKLKGEYVEPSTTAQLVGRYVESYFDGTLEDFKKEHPEIYKKTGDKGLLKDFQIAEKVIEKIESDEVFKSYMQGNVQVIKTGEICGVPIKTKTDYVTEDFISDLKIVKDFKMIWINGQKLPFIEAWHYDIQAVFYEEVQDKIKPYYILAVTKEEVPDICIFEIPYTRIAQVRSIVENYIERFQDIKEGKIKPERCEKCNYCKMTKKLTGPIDYKKVIWSKYD